MTTGQEASELTFFLAGGDDSDKFSAGDKTKAKRLLFKILKMLASKGYFGDVEKFWNDMEIKRKMANYGIVHVPLAQPIKHRQFASMMKNVGLDIVSAQQFDKSQERELDQQADPDELQQYNRDNEKEPQQIDRKNDEETDDDIEEESMSVMERYAHRYDAMNERRVYRSNVQNKKLGELLDDAIEIVNNVNPGEEVEALENIGMYLNQAIQQLG